MDLQGRGKEEDYNKGSCADVWCDRGGNYSYNELEADGLLWHPIKGVAKRRNKIKNKLVT